MTAVGLILLSAALLQTIEPRELRFISIHSCKIYWDERSRPAWAQQVIASSFVTNSLKWSTTQLSFGRCRFLKAAILKLVFDFPIHRVP